MSNANISNDMLRRIAAAVRWFEAHGRNKIAPRIRYNVNEPAIAIGGNITFKITRDEFGAGKYGAKSCTSKTSGVDPGPDLVDTDLGTFAADVDCLILNLPEMSGYTVSGHDLTNISTNAFSLFGNGMVAGQNEDGKWIVHAQMYAAGCS